VQHLITLITVWVIFTKAIEADRLEDCMANKFTNYLHPDQYQILNNYKDLLQKKSKRNQPINY